MTGKLKHGDRGSIEEEFSSPKRPDMAAEQTTEDEQLSNLELKEMLVDIKIEISRILRTNNDLVKELTQLRKEVTDHKSEIDQLKTALPATKKQNNTLASDLMAAKTLLDEKEEEIAELYDLQDNLEQYTRKQSLEIHGIPEAVYQSTEEAVLKVAAALQVPMKAEDINISHNIKGKEPKPILVKFQSHKAKTRLYRARTYLKNVRVCDIFPHASAVSRVQAKRIFINENLTSFRRSVVKKANQMRKDGLLNSVWTIDGKIFVKTSQEERPICIYEEDDLEVL